MKHLISFILTFFCLFSYSAHARHGIKDLNIQTQIDSTYVFGFNLKESRSAKGGIWNIKTGKPETPQNYSRAQKDTIDGQPVVKLYRQVALGNHPLNGWETWMLKDGKWVNMSDTKERNTNPTGKANTK